MSEKTLITLVLAPALAPCVANAQNAIATEVPWLLRVRAAYMLNENSNDLTLSLGQIATDRARSVATRRGHCICYEAEQPGQFG